MTSSPQFIIATLHLLIEMTSIDTFPDFDCRSPLRRQTGTVGTTYATGGSDTDSDTSDGWSPNSGEVEETPPTGHSPTGHSYFAKISRYPSTSHQTTNLSPVDDSVPFSSTQGSHIEDYPLTSNAASFRQTSIGGAVHDW